MVRMFVQVQKTTSGRFLPTLYWSTATEFDRESYGECYDAIQVAERVAQSWADQQGAEYRPYREVDVQAVLQQTQLVRKFREEGMNLREAICAARAKMAQEKVVD
jgi:hypothetical protein